jgi:hypothetical protein
MLGGFIQLMGPDCGLLGVERVPVDPEDIRTRLPAHCFFNPTLVFRRDVLEEVGPHRVLFEAGDDVDFALRVAERGPVANLPDALVGYRLRGDSVSDTSLVRQSTAVVAAQESFRRRPREPARPRRADEAGAAALPHPCGTERRERPRPEADRRGRRDRDLRAPSRRLPRRATLDRPRVWTRDGARPSPSGVARESCCPGTRAAGRRRSRLVSEQGRRVSGPTGR